MRLFHLLLSIRVATVLVDVQGKALRGGGSADLVSVEGIMRHLEFLHKLGKNNSSSRSVGTAGYEASVNYISTLLKNAGYNVTIQTFMAPIPEEEEDLSLPGGNITTSPVEKSTWLASREGEMVETYNVIAETFYGNKDHIIMAGAHLDSVPKGPGVNDNGSGCATLIEIALRMAEREDRPTNKVRFSFWGAEEVGLVGASYYFNQTLDQADRDQIALYLNFDMIASPNFVRFVYDTGPGSVEDHIKSVFIDFFRQHNLPVETMIMGCSSDHCVPQVLGIPTGGVFTGAGGLKTLEQAFVYGGTFGQPYDPCYHTICDDIRNINAQALDEMSHAAAYAIVTFAYTTDPSTIQPTPTGPSRGDTRSLHVVVSLLVLFSVVIFSM